MGGWGVHGRGVGRAWVCGPHTSSVSAFGAALVMALVRPPFAWPFALHADSAGPGKYYRGGVPKCMPPTKRPWAGQPQDEAAPQYSAAYYRHVQLVDKTFIR